MMQQIIAIAIILFFIIRLFVLKKNKKIGANEFIFWLVFWSLSGLIVLALKWLDKLSADLGFSSSGIQILLYVAVVILFYFNFRLRLKVEKMDKDMVKIIREIALDKSQTEEKK